MVLTSKSYLSMNRYKQCVPMSLSSTVPAKGLRTQSASTVRVNTSSLCMISDITSHDCRGFESPKAVTASAHNLDSGAMETIIGEVDIVRKLSAKGDVGWNGVYA